MPRVGGAAKGAGSKKPKQNLDTSPEKQKKRSQKASFVRQKMREWRLANPDAPELRDRPSPKQIKDVLLSGAPDALERMHNEIIDPVSPKGAEMARSWVEHVIGKARQAVDVDVKHNPLAFENVHIMTLAAEKLSTDELRVLLMLYRKMGLTLPDEPPAPMIELEAEEDE